jgi:DNA-binding beta-propeller fold protein YncE
MMKGDLMRAHLHTATALAAILFAPMAASAAPAAPGSAPAYAIVDRMAGADGSWDYASVDPAGGRLYVARSNAVMAVDLATHKVIDALAPANGAHSAFAIDGGKTVVETDGRSGLTRFIDAATGKVEDEIATGQKPDAAIYEPVSGRVVVMSPGNNTVTEIDAGTRKIVAQFTLAGGLEAADADGKGHVWANLEEAGGLTEIDAVAGKVLRTVPLPGCEGPTGLALVAGGTRVISACANGVATVTDTTSGKVLATLPIDKGPDAVLVDDSRHRAFIPCGASGTLVAIDTANPDQIAVTGRIATQVSARTGALDPRDGRIYLPAATLGVPAPGTKRGKPIAGTFVVLVLAPQS